MQNNHLKLKKRLQLFLKNIEEVKVLIQVRSDLCYITNTLSKTTIHKNGFGWIRHDASANHQRHFHDEQVSTIKEVVRSHRAI